MAVLENTYLTPEEVAKKLKVSARTVRRWAAEGKLSALRVGRQWRIPANALEQLVTSKEKFDWLEVCRRARERTAEGINSTPLLRALREGRASQ